MKYVTGLNSWKAWRYLLSSAFFRLFQPWKNMRLIRTGPIWEGEKQDRVYELIDHYMGNAKILCEAARSVGLEVFGGTNAPYIWVKTPNDAPSWNIFDRVLNEATVVITPGAGFGKAGEGYFRISAFNSRENAEEVGKRIQAIDW